MFKAFRSALGVDIRLFLTDATVQAHMTQALATNVELIKTIPPRLHESLRRRIAEAFAGRTVQSATAIPIVGAGIQIERVQPPAVDAGSTQKAERRPENCVSSRSGVTHYIWRTSEDERVSQRTRKTTGKRLRGRRRLPVTTGHPGHDVQCRCSSEPVLSHAVYWVRAIQ